MLSKFLFTDLPLLMSAYLTGLGTVVSFSSNESERNLSTYTYWGGPHRYNNIDEPHYTITITGLSGSYRYIITKMTINTIFIGIP